jgi:hypothetical protein
VGRDSEEEPEKEEKSERTEKCGHGRAKEKAGVGYMNMEFRVNAGYSLFS